MAYVQFKALLTEDAEVVWDAEWFTDREAEERFGDLQDVVADYPDLYRIALTDDEVRVRNETAAQYWDFVSGDRVAVEAHGER